MQSDLFIRGALGLLLLLAAVTAVPQAAAQSLVEMYRSARFRALAEEMLETHGLCASPLPSEKLPYATDSVRQQMLALFPPPEPEPEPDPAPSITIRKRTLTPKLGGEWFERRFEDTGWAYLGSNELHGIDTIYTRDLRARMEAQFGSPTRTIAERGDDPSAEYIQFQYWFVLNDSIPMNVMDVNGPFERGVVVATDRKYRHLLPYLKETLLGPVVESPERAAYVDYYFLKDLSMWFLTGYDGERFFIERISRPNLRIGRPLLNTVLDRADAPR